MIFSQSSVCALLGLLWEELVFSQLRSLPQGVATQNLTDRIDSTAPVVIPAPLWVTGGSGMIFPVTEDVFQKN